MNLLSLESMKKAVWKCQPEGEVAKSSSWLFTYPVLQKAIRLFGLFCRAIGISGRENNTLLLVLLST